MLATWNGLNRSVGNHTDLDRMTGSLFNKRVQRLFYGRFLRFALWLTTGCIRREDLVDRVSVHIGHFSGEFLHL